MNYKSNWKNATSKQSYKELAWGLVAPVIYLIPSTFLKLEGYVGLTVSTALTWFVGAMTGKKAIQYGALAIGAVHFAYGKGSGTITKLLGRPLWRLSDANDVADALKAEAEVKAQIKGGIAGLAEANSWEMPSGGQVFRLDEDHEFNPNNETYTAQQLTDGSVNGWSESPTLSGYDGAFQDSLPMRARAI